jgi:predicted aspartyl protease
MKTIIQGEINNLDPLFRAYVSEGLIVFSNDGDISLTVDTGFDGEISLPQYILDDIDLELMGYNVFVTATGERIELPLFLGKALVEEKEINTLFIPGDFLVGMGFLQFSGKSLVLDFEESTVKLLG